MLHRLILKVTKFQRPPPTRLSAVTKNIFGGPSCPLCRIALKVVNICEMQGTGGLEVVVL